MKPGCKPYILHVGNGAWYKNRAGVIRIFAAVREHADVELVLAGPPPERSVQRLLRQCNVREFVRVVHNPDDLSLRGLYGNAALLLFPSIYEGFGWPPLEAMAMGCPVVCSSAASLPEVVSDAGLTAAAEDVLQLADHCLAILRYPQLAEDLVAKGRRRAAGFTLERMGGDLVAAYDRAMKQHAGID